MTTFIWPSSVVPSSLVWTPVNNARTFTSTFNKTDQTVDLGGARWSVSATFPPRRDIAAQSIRALISRLSSGVDDVALWDQKYSFPFGSMRGVCTLGGAHAMGVDVLYIQTLGGTLFAGDKIGVGCQVFQVVQDAISNVNGLMEVKVWPRTWSAFSDGTPVTWRNPCARFKLETPTGIGYQLGDIAEGFQLTFMQRVSTSALVAQEVSPSRNSYGAVGVITPAVKTLNSTSENVF